MYNNNSDIYNMFNFKCNTMKTAVEKLINEISQDRVGQAIIKTFFKEFEDAKKLEREQKIDFARHCLNKATDLDILTSFMNAEQYYNETFKSE